MNTVGGVCLAAMAEQEQLTENYLRNQLFAGISLEVLRELTLGIRERRFEAGEVLFEEGEPGSAVYLVREGEVQLSKRGPLGEQEQMALVGPGDYFGVVAILDGGARSTRATATRETVAGLLSREDFDRFFGHCPEAARQIAGALSRQLRTTHTEFIAKLSQAQRLSLLGTMMGSMVHDLRNPVATLGQVGNILNAQKEQPRFLRLGRVTENAVEQISGMIQELLDFSRGKICLNISSFPMSDFMHALDGLILEKMEKAGITVVRRVEFEGELKADQHRLLRLFVNLIKNSWEAMRDSGVLTLRIRKVREDLQIEIADTGRGIEPDLLEHVFEAFVTSGKTNGTGLGMSIAKSMVEAHGGTIRLESEVGVGTTCHLSLPVCPPDRPPCSDLGGAVLQEA